MSIHLQPDAASASVGHMMGRVGNINFESSGSRGVHLGALFFILLGLGVYFTQRENGPRWR